MKTRRSRPAGMTQLGSGTEPRNAFKIAAGGLRSQKRLKYGNQPVEYDGRRFDEALYRAALDRLLADLAEFMARYAWTNQHDDALALYERLKTARALLERMNRVAQGAVR